MLSNYLWRLIIFLFFSRTTLYVRQRLMQYNFIEKKKKRGKLEDISCHHKISTFCVEIFFTIKFVIADEWRGNTLGYCSCCHWKQFKMFFFLLGTFRILINHTLFSTTAFMTHSTEQIMNDIFIHTFLCGFSSSSILLPEKKISSPREGICKSNKLYRSTYTQGIASL